MKLAYLLAIPVLLAVAACSEGSTRFDDAAPNLALACQTLPCECVEDTEGLFLKRAQTDIVWKNNGEASCPKGYALKSTGLKR